MQSALCYSFLFVEVSGYGCFPDRCYGKSELLFLDSTLYGNLQWLVFLGNWSSKEEALTCRKSAMTLFWNLKHSDTNCVRKKKKQEKKSKKKNEIISSHSHSFTSSKHNLSHCNGNVKKIKQGNSYFPTIMLVLIFSQHSLCQHRA